MEYSERKSPRARWHDYGGGIYFVTIVTHNRISYFGHVDNCEMNMSDNGIIANNILCSIPNKFPYIELYNHVVMPNHVHLLIGINVEEAPRNSRANDIDEDKATNRAWLGTLSLFIRQVKASISHDIHTINHDFAWQRSFHDHIVRDERSFNMIHEYITHNPERWDKDVFNTEL